MAQRSRANVGGRGLRRGEVRVAALLLLAACSSKSDDKIEGAQSLDCKFPGQSNFHPLCTVETSGSPDGTVLTARMPDGGFRRFLLVGDARRVIAADGAEQVEVKAVRTGSVDVEADDVVYRLPVKAAP